MVPVDITPHFLSVVIFLSLFHVLLDELFIDEELLVALLMHFFSSKLTKTSQRYLQTKFETLWRLRRHIWASDLLRILRH